MNDEAFENQRKRIESMSQPIARKWSVSVQVDGVNVLNISSDDYSGVENIGEYRSEVLEAAENLIAFLGNDAGLFFDPSEDDE